MIVIMCAGRSVRFGEHKPKCLADFLGKPNLYRTIELIDSLTNTKISVTCFKERFYYFNLPAHINVIFGTNKKETDRFSNAFPLSEPTLFLYGDVVYHPDDLALILEEHQSGRETKWFGRKGINRLTGKNHGELMGVSVKDIARFEKAVFDTYQEFKQRKRKMCIGWDVLEVHEGLNRKDCINFVTLSDYTDDFDYKQDLQNLIKLYNERVYTTG